ncbi:MAG: twin-arginine translocation signal domain-containing protein, partial [Betaproteobacteria bacterium]|nr:twin-arginine translocation signal domain-containing protein [Betaproteobacteria bacterium]
MTETTRRQFIQSTGVATGAAAVAPLLWTSSAQAQWNNVPEPGAKLRVLRWSRFVQGELDAYMANVKRFTEKTGI